MTPRFLGVTPRFWSAATAVVWAKIISGSFFGGYTVVSTLKNPCASLPTLVWNIQISRIGLDRLKGLYSEMLICVRTEIIRIQIVPDYTGVGLESFHCIGFHFISDRPYGLR